MAKLLPVQAIGRAFEFELHAGEMLYLPCGWFHEVRSYGNSKEGGHLALNYWFHPPDNLDASCEGMQHPYRYNGLCTTQCLHSAILCI